MRKLLYVKGTLIVSLCPCTFYYLSIKGNYIVKKTDKLQ